MPCLLASGTCDCFADALAPFQVRSLSCCHRGLCVGGEAYNEVNDGYLDFGTSDDYGTSTSLACEEVISYSNRGSADL